MVACDWLEQKLNVSTCLSLSLCVLLKVFEKYWALKLDVVRCVCVCERVMSGVCSCDVTVNRLQMCLILWEQKLFSFRSCEFIFCVCWSSVSRCVSVTPAEIRAGFVSRSQMKVVILCDLTEELWDMLEVFVTQMLMERMSPVTREHYQTGRALRVTRVECVRQKPAIMSRTKEHSRLFPVCRQLQTVRRNMENMWTWTSSDTNQRVTAVKLQFISCAELYCDYRAAPFIYFNFTLNIINYPLFHQLMNPCLEN